MPIKENYQHRGDDDDDSDQPRDRSSGIALDFYDLSFFSHASYLGAILPGLRAAESLFS